MSKHNKVNPGRYTQRGRLTQDDAAREFARQRAIGAQHAWQPVQKNAMPRLESVSARADTDAETSEDTETAPVTADRPRATKPRATTAAPVKAKAKKAKAKKTNTAKTSKPAVKARATRTTRKAVLARNTGGGQPRATQSTKRRKS